MDFFYIIFFVNLSLLTYRCPTGQDRGGDLKHNMMDTNSTDSLTLFKQALNFYEYTLTLAGKLQIYIYISNRRRTPTAIN